MVNRVVYPCFTEEQTEAWRLDHQPQGTWLVNSSAQTQSVLFQSPCSLNVPFVASLTAMWGDQVAPGSNFSSGSTPSRTHATLVGNSQWEINLCLQGPIIQSRRKRAMWAWAQAKHWLPLPLPLPVEAAGKSREGGRETPTLVWEDSYAWLSSNTKLYSWDNYGFSLNLKNCEPLMSHSWSRSIQKEFNSLCLPVSRS